MVSFGRFNPLLTNRLKILKDSFLLLRLAAPFSPVVVENHSIWAEHQPTRPVKRVVDLTFVASLNWRDCDAFRTSVFVRCLGWSVLVKVHDDSERGRNLTKTIYLFFSKRASLVHICSKIGVTWNILCFCKAPFIFQLLQSTVYLEQYGASSFSAGLPQLPKEACTFRTTLSGFYTPPSTTPIKQNYPLYNVVLKCVHVTVGLKAKFPPEGSQCFLKHSGVM